MDIVSYLLSKNYTNRQIADLKANGISFTAKIVSELPEQGETGTIYLVKKTGLFSRNSYLEYIWVNSENDFEEIGTSKIDLSNYYTKDEIDPKISELTGELDTINKNASTRWLPVVDETSETKILQVLNGSWTMVTPNIIYIGSETPPAELGNDGDIYLQNS